MWLVEAVGPSHYGVTHLPGQARGADQGAGGDPTLRGQVEPTGQQQLERAAEMSAAHEPSERLKKWLLLHVPHLNHVQISLAGNPLLAVYRKADFGECPTLAN